MLFLLYKDQNGGWQAYKEVGVIKEFETMEAARLIAFKFRDTKIFNLDHTIEEQLKVANNYARTVNELTGLKAMH